MDWQSAFKKTLGKYRWNARSVRSTIGSEIEFYGGLYNGIH